MILSDLALTQILSLVVQSDGKPVPACQINPASIDLTLGDVVHTEQYANRDLQRSGLAKDAFAEISLAAFSKELPYCVKPGGVVRVCTAETIALPSHLGGQVLLKSSRARAGWDMAHAGWFDPGWVGVGTFLIINTLTNHTLPIWPGQRFFQLLVTTLSSPVGTLYDGHYQGAKSVEGAKA
jgi:deoxycytidine triphosphate deaminase